MTETELIPIAEQARPTWSTAEKDARTFAQAFRARRSIRQFSSEKVPQNIIRAALESAVSAPSGANLQPWRFVAINDPAIRRHVRHLAEAEEADFHSGRSDPSLFDAVRSLGTRPEKPYLEQASWIIGVFAKEFGQKSAAAATNVYVGESVGIATGVLISALHMSGVDTLVHVPVAETYLTELAGCGEGEHLAMLVLAGRRASGATAPKAGVRKQPFHAVASFIGPDFSASQSDD
jgi:iodotyrosine deiodinase